MIHALKYLGLGLGGAGSVVIVLLLIPMHVANPPEKEKPVVQGKIEDPKKKEEEQRRKLEEELKKKLEEEKRKLEEERRLAELEVERKRIEDARAEIEEQRKRLEEERLRIERERAEMRRPPTPEELRRMIEEAVAKQAPPSPPTPAPPPLEPAPELKPELAPEVPPADVNNPPSKRKGNFFIYVDAPHSAPLETLRRNGFALAVADSDGFITHVVRMDGSNRVVGYKEFGRDDRSVYGDVMFRLREPRRIEGLAAVDRAVSQAFEGSSLKLLILRTTYNQAVAPLIQQGQRFAEKYNLDFDGIRLTIDEGPAWEGIYSKGKFYRKP